MTLARIRKSHIAFFENDSRAPFVAGLFDIVCRNNIELVWIFAIERKRT